MDVSIIITAYTDRGYLKQAISDAKKQKFNGTYEVILASDANPKLARYAKEFGLVYSQTKSKLGFSNNFNTAALIAKGKYLKVLADDDRIPSGCIQSLYDQINGTKHSMVHANATSFKKGKAISRFKPKHKDPSLQILLNSNPFHGGTIMYNKDHFINSGMYNTFLLFCEEYEMYLRLKNRGGTFCYVDKFVYLYRVHKNQKSTVFREVKEKTKNLIKNKYGI